jgi:hypothetical protein
MRLRLKTRVITLATLLPLLAAAVAGLGYDRFRCAFTGEVSESSCCPAEDAPTLPVASGASCCDHESARSVRVPAEASSPTIAALDLRLLPLGEAAPPVARPTAALPPPTRAHAPPSPPLLLVKQSFLI